MNPFSLKGKRFLVTGAASGIGRATSIILSELGAELFLIDINMDELLETKFKCKNETSLLNVDLTNVNILLALTEYGKINGFVHCAGVSYVSPLKSLDRDKYYRVHDINTYVAIKLAKLFINKDIYSGDKGSIIFISSICATVGMSANVGYAASKGALHSITKTLAIELATKNIRVNCVAPGFINTPMLDKNMNTGTIKKLHPFGIGEPEDVAYAVAFLLSDASRWITGTIITVDGGYTAQ